MLKQKISNLITIAREQPGKDLFESATEIFGKNSFQTGSQAMVFPELSDLMPSKRMLVQALVAQMTNIHISLSSDYLTDQPRLILKNPGDKPVVADLTIADLREETQDPSRA